MRPIILATALTVLAPIALAQTFQPGGAANPGPTGGANYYATGPATPSRSASPTQKIAEHQTSPKHVRRCRAGRYGLIQRTVSDLGAQ